MLDILKFPKYSKYELHIIELMWSDRTMKYEIYFIVSVDQIEKWINSRSPDLIKKKQFSNCWNTQIVVITIVFKKTFNNIYKVIAQVIDNLLFGCDVLMYRTFSISMLPSVFCIKTAWSASILMVIFQLDRKMFCFKCIKIPIKYL